jgi:hypothetical protein
MPDTDYTALGVIVDESGSMSSHKETAIDGYNEFLDNQKQLDEGRATLTRTIFSHEFPPRSQHAELDSAEPLSATSYQPGGRTALLDAVGYTIDEMGKRFDAMDEGDKPANVLVAIITDGKENASEEYSPSQIREMVREQEEQWGWEFIYIGAGVEDFSDPDAMGVSQDRRAMQSKDTDGVRDAYDQVAAAAANARTKGTSGDFREGGRLDFDEEPDEED